MIQINDIQEYLNDLGNQDYYLKDNKNFLAMLHAYYRYCDFRSEESATSLYKWSMSFDDENTNPKRLEEIIELIIKPEHREELEYFFLLRQLQ